MVRIGLYTFPEAALAVRVTREEILSRVRKTVRLDALLGPFASMEDLLAERATLEGELARLDSGDAHLHLVPGRYHAASRREHQWAIDAHALTFAAHLLLITEDPFERSTDTHEIEADLASIGGAVTISHAGNIPSRPALVLTAAATVQRPVITDGARTLVWDGLLAPGDVLALDADRLTAWRNGTENVLLAISGDFPRIAPGGSTLSCAAQGAGPPHAALRVTWRDWWD